MHWTDYQIVSACTMRMPIMPGWHGQRVAVIPDLTSRWSMVTIRTMRWWPRYIYFPMDECTPGSASNKFSVYRFQERGSGPFTCTQKSRTSSKVWLMFLCPKSFLRRFNFPADTFENKYHRKNQISCFVEKHASHFKLSNRIIFRKFPEDSWSVNDYNISVMMLRVMCSNLITECYVIVLCYQQEGQLANG